MFLVDLAWSGRLALLAQALLGCWLAAFVAACKPESALGLPPASVSHGAALLHTAHASAAPQPGALPATGVLFTGACDASGAVTLDRSRFVLADDEDNFLRLYDAEQGGAPLRRLDVSEKLSLRKRNPESDLEAAARIGNEAYWLTSHARNRKGKLKPERLLFFATALPNAQDAIELVGEPYRDLQTKLLHAPGFAALDLQRAAELAPKEPGGFNIEGMTATPEGALLLGLRSPVPDGVALLLTLHNPRAVLWGAEPEFSEPIRLDLGGLGVRGLSWWHGKYLILAGPPADGPSRLYAWAGLGHPVEALPIDLSAINPEAFFTPEDRDDILLLSDDGTLPVAGTQCKSLKNNSHKRFRGVWVKPY